ncbi:MAG TPA: hypothetical protein VMO17_05595 [Terriglobia bacterium]|nr:hypothetical protein [Terriglobia bacterium]
MHVSAYLGRNFSGECTMLAMLALGIPGNVFWPYFAGAVVLAAGLPVVIKTDVPLERGWEKVIPFGRLLFAMPMAVFGAEHFTAARVIAGVVPAWMPAPQFWVYLVGVALLSAALSLATKKFASLAALLVGIMLLLFVLMIHIPNAVAQHGDRFRWAVACRDLSFSGGALAFAGAHAEAWLGSGRRWLINTGRLFIAVPALFFGVEHFLHPGYVPGIPLDKLMATWIPGRFFWAYLTGVVLIGSGVALLLKRQVRLAATCLGVTILLVVLFVYLPTLVVHPADIGNELNYVVDTMVLSGAALLLADAAPREGQPQGVRNQASRLSIP